MATQAKLGTPRGVREWQALESVGDVKRFLRWVILSMRANRLDRQDAAVFTQVANTLLRALEGSDLEQRLADLERMLLEEKEKKDGYTPKESRTT
jgi:hypothetical protein